VRTIRGLEREEEHIPRVDTVDLLARAMGLSEEEHNLFAAATKRRSVRPRVGRDPVLATQDRARLVDNFAEGATSEVRSIGVLCI
jgi:hypothetical protein